MGFLTLCLKYALSYILLFLSCFFASLDCNPTPKLLQMITAFIYSLVAFVLDIVSPFLYGCIYVFVILTFGGPP